MNAQEPDMMFPTRFTWGAASSAYQIEGAANVDGRGPSVWDEFCRRPGAVHGGSSGEVACDHYNRFADDVELMRTIGLQAYRFSTSWSRVFPDGVAVNERGLAFYDRLVDALLERGIEPWLTLYHWDMPQALFCRGGWLNRDSAEWFAEYAAVMARRLSDRVSHWITINEPQIYIGLGHGDAIHAPGLKLSMRERLLATHHTLLAHGRAVQELRANARRSLQIGWAPVGRVVYPVNPLPGDVEAARQATFAVTKRDCWNNTWFSDPVCLGEYPADGLEIMGEDAPRPRTGDMDTIHQPLDFYGLNIYSGEPIRAGADGEAVPAVMPPGAPQTTMRWLIAPESLYWGPRFLHERYKLPIVITENGMANIDVVDLGGRVRDPQRIDFTHRYLLELGRAAADGVDVRGYFHWSIMDNFEWAEGYKERFGLIHVDYATQRRTLKDSALWYAGVIASNGESLRLGQTPGVEVVTSARHQALTGRAAPR
jgi:beta-glucosidase